MYFLHNGMQNMLLCHQIPPYFTHIISSLPNHKLSLPATMQARTTVKIFQMLDKIIFNPSSKVSRNDYHLFLLGGRENDIYKLFYLEGII